MRVGMNYWWTRAELAWTMAVILRAWGLFGSMESLEQNTKLFIQQKIIHPKKCWEINFRLKEIVYKANVPTKMT